MDAFSSVMSMKGKGNDESLKDHAHDPSLCLDCMIFFTITTFVTPVMKGVIVMVLLLVFGRARHGQGHGRDKLWSGHNGRGHDGNALPRRSFLFLVFLKCFLILFQMFYKF